MKILTKKEEILIESFIDYVGDQMSTPEERDTIRNFLIACKNRHAEDESERLVAWSEQ